MILNKLQIFTHKRVLAVLTLCIGLIAGTVFTMVIPNAVAELTICNNSTGECSNDNDPEPDFIDTDNDGTSNRGTEPTPVPKVVNPTSVPEPTNSAPQSPVTNDTGGSSTEGNPPAPCQ